MGRGRRSSIVGPRPTHPGGDEDETHYGIGSRIVEVVFSPVTAWASKRCRHVTGPTSVSHIAPEPVYSRGHPAGGDIPTACIKKTMGSMNIRGQCIIGETCAPIEIRH